MRTHANDRLQGTLDMLVLRALSLQGRMHGYTITLRIEQIFASVLRLEEGSFYPALHRMTQPGWLRAGRGASESNVSENHASENHASENNRPARYYSITPSGRKQFAGEEQNRAPLTEAVTRVHRFV
jgi:PadR family transcriptional regulator PadR